MKNKRLEKIEICLLDIAYALESGRKLGIYQRTAIKLMAVEKRVAKSGKKSKIRIVSYK